jgi:hypothetical protein
MAPFLIFLITGLATGYQLFQQIMWGVWGKPPNPFEFIGLLGSLILVIAGYGALFSLRIFRWLALIALIPLWIYYVPALLNTITDTFSGRYVFEIIVFAPPIFLCFASIFIFLSVFSKARPAFFSPLFPASTSKIGKVAVFLITGLFFIVCIVTDMFFIGVDHEVVTPVTWVEKEVHGRPMIQFTFINLDGFSNTSMDTDSFEVITFLHSQKSNTTEIKVVLTYDFGKVRALGFNYAYLGDIRFKPEADYGP